MSTAPMMSTTKKIVAPMSVGTQTAPMTKAPIMSTAPMMSVGSTTINSKAPTKSNIGKTVGNLAKGVTGYIVGGPVGNIIAQSLSSSKDANIVANPGSMMSTAQGGGFIGPMENPNRPVQTTLGVGESTGAGDGVILQGHPSTTPMPTTPATGATPSMPVGNINPNFNGTFTTSMLKESMANPSTVLTLEEKLKPYQDRINEARAEQLKYMSPGQDEINLRDELNKTRESIRGYQSGVQTELDRI